MSATSAYARIVSERLAGLQPQRVPGYQTLVDFTERRLRLMSAPANPSPSGWRTCRADLMGELADPHSDRDHAVAPEHGSAALDEQRTQMQLRLQQTVEGLSVLAISYYAVGIIGYMVKPFMHLMPQLSEAMYLGVVTPVVVLVVWYFIRRIRRAGSKP